MRILTGNEEQLAIKSINKAAQIALNSCCLRSKCGCIIVNHGRIIGIGWNSPPGDKKIKKCFKEDLPKDFISDKTCCIHAEDRAIRDALARNSAELKGSRLYFIRLDKNNKITKAGDPYCTWCSKTALDVGIKEFVLWHAKGICVYDTEEYNKISFKLR
jgi:deoxycytidylate deaminase